MNYEKLSTENGNCLFVKSMNKLHRISYLAFNEEGHKLLFDKKDLICVAGFPNINDVQAMALRYQGDSKIKLQDKSSEDRPYTGFYIQAYDSNFYQVAGVFTDVDEANQFMALREDAALIDSTNLKHVDKQYHFIACLDKSKKIG